MIKLRNILSENISKDMHYWHQNYNILGVVQGFCQQYHQKLGKDFWGKLNIIFYDRKDKELINDRVYTAKMLDGFLPRDIKGKSEFWDEDFHLTVDKIYPISKLKSQLQDIQDKATIIQLNNRKNPENGWAIVEMVDIW